MSKIVSVDHSLCKSFAVCVAVAPDYFELDGEGKLVVLQESVDPGDEDTIGEAEMVCPTQAIITRES
jgi:ferredoxin